MYMDEQKISHFKKKLLDEKERLEKELSSLGHINSDNPNDWESDGGDIVQERDTDPNLKADNFEEADNRSAILNLLETQLVDVNNALDKIETGKYGICEVSGENISEERLEANPSSRNCENHI